jgi:hypothetical protein
MHPGAGRPAGRAAFVPDGAAAGRDYPDLQRRAVPAKVEHVRLFLVQPDVRRRRPDSRRPLYPRSCPRRWQYLARRRRPLPAAAAQSPAVLQHDRLPGRVEDGRMESGILYIPLLSCPAKPNQTNKRASLRFYVSCYSSLPVVLLWPANVRQPPTN